MKNCLIRYQEEPSLMDTYDSEDEIPSGDGVYYLGLPAFSSMSHRKTPYLPDPRVKDINIGSTQELDIDSFEIMRKKSISGKHNHLLFVGFRGKIPNAIKKWFSGKDIAMRNRFKKHVPLMEPKDYTTMNHMERKTQLLQKFLYVISLDEKNFDNYIYLVEESRLNSSLETLMQLVCSQEKLYRIDNIKARFHEMERLLIATRCMLEDTPDKNINRILGLSRDHYFRFMLYFYLYLCAGDELYIVFRDEFISPVTIQLFSHEILWLLHLVNPELENHYKQYFCLNMGIEYTPSYAIAGGGAFAKHIENIISYGDTLLDTKAKFLLRSNGLNEDLAWKHKSRSADSFTEDEREDIIKTVAVLNNDPFFVTVMALNTVKNEITIKRKIDINKDTELKKIQNTLKLAGSIEEEANILNENKVKIMESINKLS